MKNKLNNASIKDGDYIIISSTGYFSRRKFKSYIVNLSTDKIYTYTYDESGNDKYEYYKDLSIKKKNKLIKYIQENDLLNVNFNKIVFDANDNIEINMFGKKNIIKNASRKFTENEIHIFDDIVDIVFHSNNLFKQIKKFFQ